MRFACIADYVITCRPKAAEAKEGQIVYFVGADEGPVKIGTTTEPHVRLQRMQSGSPVTLKIIAAVPGGSLLESGYHTVFADHRLHGEWFNRSPLIEQEMRHWRAKKRRLSCVSL